MATKVICDGGCGKESPDAAGYLIANHWIKVKACVPFAIGRVSAFDRDVKLILCRDCARRGFEAINRLGDWKRDSDA